MTNDLEKQFFQCFGIEPRYEDACTVEDEYWNNEELANEYGTFDKFMEKNCKFGYQDCTEECEYAYTKTNYPPFTAEKQIELIKLLGDVRDYTVEIDKFKGVYYVGCREAGSNNKHWGSHNLFEEALAELVNDLWQDLTKEEQEQIREILK